MVIIEITTSRGTENHKVWDTSNRVINLVINNLKGIFSKTTILSIRPSVWWQSGAKLAEQPSAFVSYRVGKSPDLLKSYEVFKNVTESMKKTGGYLCETGCNQYGLVIFMQ